MHNLNYESIFSYFLDSDFDVEPTTLFDCDALSVSFEVDSEIVTIVHMCIQEITQLPHFYLMNSQKFGRLAHILPVPEKHNIGSICVNEQDSVSVNFERPELVFEESIKRHIALLNSLIRDSVFNDKELLREFNANWDLNTRDLLGDNVKTLYCEADRDRLELFDLYKVERDLPIEEIPDLWVASPKNESDANIDVFFNKKKRQVHQSAITCVLSLQSVETDLPSNLEQLKAWLCDAFLRIDKKTQDFFNSKLLNQKAKEFWLIFNVETPSGVSWFCIRLLNDKKKAFPNSIEKIRSWSLKPLLVKIFNKELLMPRSGAKRNLDGKKVLLVGAGSVGSELADKLGAMGIGCLDITDPDTFSTSNLYRHTLNRQYIGCPKSLALQWQLESKYPWINVRPCFNKLLAFRELNESLSFIELSEFFNLKVLDNYYDLIIVAIGSPTHERVFHDYVTKNILQVPIIYTWLEGYGVGGHAVLDIPNKKGCLRCAYVDPETGIRGLASNLNFLQSDQDIVKNYAGCGEMFIPYGAMSSAQTALIAGDLAMGYLDGKLTEPTKVSWKGSDEDAKDEGLKFTKRYKSFSSSLQRQPLCHPLCDVCNNVGITLYQHDNFRIILPNTIKEQLIKFRQNDLDDCESAGLLVGHVKNNGDTWINNITTPKETDIRSRAFFKLDDVAHQNDLDNLHASSDQLLGYLGTWHTHPQNIPIPSSVDIEDWKKHYNENIDRRLFFVVVGLKKVSIYTIESKEVLEVPLIKVLNK